MQKLLYGLKWEFNMLDIKQEKAEKILSLSFINKILKFYWEFNEHYVGIFQERFVNKTLEPFSSLNFISYNLTNLNSNNSIVFNTTNLAAAVPHASVGNVAPRNLQHGQRGHDGRWRPELAVGHPDPVLAAGRLHGEEGLVRLQGLSRLAVPDDRFCRHFAAVQSSLIKF